MEKDMAAEYGVQAKQIMMNMKENIKRIIRMDMAYINGQMVRFIKVVSKTI
jgi:hypothetical protein